MKQFHFYLILGIIGGIVAFACKLRVEENSSLAQEGDKMYLCGVDDAISKGKSSSDHGIKYYEARIYVRVQPSPDGSTCVQLNFN